MHWWWSCAKGFRHIDDGESYFDDSDCSYIDDDLEFEENVDQGIERDKGKQKEKAKEPNLFVFESNVVDNDDENDTSYGDSEDLCSICTLSDNDGTGRWRYLEFRESDMNDPKFVVGMKFSNIG